MTPDRHAQIKEVFLSACRVEKGRRQEWLEKTCGADSELCREVQRLLMQHTQDAPAEETAPTHAAGTEVEVYRIEGGAEAGAAGTFQEWAGPARNFPPGHKLADRYRIVCLLGRGGMGEIYRAEDLVLGQNVALKFLPAHLSRDPHWLARMRHEVQIARRITHPHVCRVHDVEEAGGDVFVAMEYVDGEDLRELLERIGRFPYEKALQLAREICMGLAAAHAQGIIHRDLKPANIMIDALGHARITDFGLAALHGEIKAGETRAGTPAYMSPEQLAGGELTIRSDLYALGLVLYELLTGQSPYRGRTLSEFAELRRSPPSVLPSSLIEQIDPQVERVILRCLEPDPNERPASAALIAAALPGPGALSTALLAGETLPPEMVAEGDELDWLRPMRVWPSLLAFGVMLGGLVILSSRTHPLQREPLRDSPDAMAGRARDIALELGMSDPRYEVYGLESGSSLPGLPVVQTRDPQPGDGLVFWYRAGPDLITAMDAYTLVFQGARADLDDPPDVAVGAVRLILDTRGRLCWYEHHLGSGLDPPDGRVMSWERVLELAGVESAAAWPTAPRVQRAHAADAQSAWLGRMAGSDVPVRIETAQTNGVITFLAVMAVERSSHATWLASDLERRQHLRRAAQASLIAVLVAISIPLARRNFRRGRCDELGALRVSAVVFMLRLAAWLLQTPLPAGVWPAWRLGVLGLTGALAEAGLVALLYMALEPFARRLWPQTLVSWSRVLRGWIVDGRVGRDLLAGALLGALLALFFKLDDLIGVRVIAGAREPLLPGDYYQSLVSLPTALAYVLDAFRTAVYGALALMLLIVLLRTWVSSSVIAGLLSFVLIAPIFVPRGRHMWFSPLLIGVGAVGSMIVAFIRLGLLAVAAALFVASVLIPFPLTLDLSAWYSGLSLLAIISTLLVAGGAGYLATRPPRWGYSDQRQA